MSQATDLSFLTTSTGVFRISSGIQATSTTTGALQVAGGAGIGGNLFVGGSLTATSIYVGPWAVSTGTSGSAGIATTATNLANGAAGLIPIQSAAGITSFIPTGSNNQVLTWSGTTATWAAAPGGSTVNTVAQTTNATYYLTFVPDNNASAAAENVYTTSSFVINPSTGNVGISNGSPGYKLEVTGDLRLGSGGDLRLGSATGTTTSGGDSQIYNDANNMIFTTGASTAERMRIDSSGNLLIGASSIASNTSQLNMEGYNAVGGTGYHGFMYIKNKYGSATAPKKWFRLNSSGGVEIVNDAYNAVIFTFANNGDFTASGNVTAYSDLKIKDNIIVIENAVEKVNKLKGVTFNRIDKDDTSMRYAGVIAQDVESVLPEAVFSNKTMSHGEVKSVDYNGIIGLLIEAVKEQQKQINELKYTISELKKE